MQHINETMINSHLSTSARAFSLRKASRSVDHVDPQRQSTWNSVRIGFAGILGAVLVAGGMLLHPSTVQAEHLSRGFNKRGNLLIADQFNNRVIRVSPAGQIVASYGLPLAGGAGPIGDNVGFDTRTTQKGLYALYDAKVIGDFTGLTPPFDRDDDDDSLSLIPSGSCSELAGLRGRPDAVNSPQATPAERSPFGASAVAEVESLSKGARSHMSGDRRRREGRGDRALHRI